MNKGLKYNEELMVITMEECGELIQACSKAIRNENYTDCLLYTSPSPRDLSTSRMPSSA